MLSTSAFSFDRIFFVLARNKDNHKNTDEFEIRPNQTTDCGVSCPRAPEKLMFNVGNTLAPSFLIGYSSFLQVTRTTIISRMCTKFGQIGPRTAELAALEHLEKST